MAFPQGWIKTGATLREGGMGVHMPALRNADPGIPKTGSLPSTSGFPGAARPLPRQGRKPQRTQRLGKTSPYKSNRLSRAHTSHCLMCACGSARNLADPISNFPRQAAQDPRRETAESRGGAWRRAAAFRSGYPRPVGIRQAASIPHSATSLNHGLRDLGNRPPDHAISVRQVHQVYRARIHLSPSDDAEYDRVSK